jgi:hypothetical protein
MPLFPTPLENASANAVDSKVELVEALADLLLEALGHESNGEGGDDESEDHS